VKLTADERARLEAIAAEADALGLRPVRTASGTVTLSPKPPHALARRIRQLGAAFRIVLEYALRERPTPRRESKAGWATVSSGDVEVTREHIVNEDGSEFMATWRKGGW
jgi:hypothetical protein